MLSFKRTGYKNFMSQWNINIHLLSTSVKEAAFQSHSSLSFTAFQTFNGIADLLKVSYTKAGAYVEAWNSSTIIRGIPYVSRRLR